MSTKGNWSDFNSLKIITTQKYSNRFENDVEKLPLLIVLTVTFHSQRIFEWSLFHWKLDILCINLNINFSWFGFILRELWPFEVETSEQSNLSMRVHVFKFARAYFEHVHAQAFPYLKTSFFRAQSFPIWLGSAPRPLRTSNTLWITMKALVFWAYKYPFMPSTKTLARERDYFHLNSSKNLSSSKSSAHTELCTFLVLPRLSITN